MIKTIRIAYLTAGLLLLLSMGAAAATPPMYNFLTRVVENFEATAGDPTGVSFLVENKGSSLLSLDVSLPLNPSGYFSIDTVNSTKDIQPGQTRGFYVHFQSPQTGSFSALLMVTDGTLTDTLTVTATVLPGQGDFSVHPLMTTRSTFVNTPVQIPISVQNLTDTYLTLQTILYANPAFTFSGTDSITLPPYGSHVFLLDFLSSADGEFQGRLTVQNGNFSLETIFSVFVRTRKYAWVVDPIYPDEVAIVGQADRFLFSVDNTGPNAVNLQVALNGSSVFSMDPADQSFTLDPGSGRDLHIGILSTTLGTFSTLITVTDGVKTDSINLTARIIDGPGRFEIFFSPPIMPKENVSATMNVLAMNNTDSSIDLSLTFTGDSHFTYNGANPVTLGPKTSQDIVIDFAAAPPGTYIAKLHATDGIDVDSVQLVATVRDEPDFFKVSDPSQGAPTLEALTFEAHRDSTTTKPIQIENVSGDTLSLIIDLEDDDGDFAVSQTHLFLNANETASLDVSYTNQGRSKGNAKLHITGRTQTQRIFLTGWLINYNDVNGFRVVKSMKFYAADTSDQDCEDTDLRNKSTENIMVISAVLSGFCSNFTMKDLSYPIILRGANDRARLNICYDPTVPGAKDTEILTVTFDNPASNPRVQTLNVYLYGESRAPSPNYIVNFVAMTARIDDQEQTTFALQNRSATDITFETIQWETGNEHGEFSLVTALPVTLPGADPAIPGSGTANITVQYAPTAQSSTVGTEDFAVFRLKSGPVNPPWISQVQLYGTPLPHSAPESQLLLFPKDRRTQEIDLGNVPLDATRSLQFMNNLQAAVTISGFDFAGSRFDIVNEGDFPVTIEPMESVTLELRCVDATSTPGRELASARGSHETLGSDFAVLSGTGTLGTDDPLPAPRAVTLSLSPNPSRGNVTMQLSAPLQHASILIVDMLGRMVADVAIPRMQTWTWNGVHDGAAVPPGLYSIFIRGVDSDGRPVQLTNNVLIVR